MFKIGGLFKMSQILSSFVLFPFTDAVKILEKSSSEKNSPTPV
jgi:hypothetical protein